MKNKKIKHVINTYPVIYYEYRQTGTSNHRKDVKRDALPPGKRISKNGKIYYEYRANRTDLPRKDTTAQNVFELISRVKKKTKKKKKKKGITSILSIFKF